MKRYRNTYYQTAGGSGGGSFDYLTDTSQDTYHNGAVVDTGAGDTGGGSFDYLTDTSQDTYLNGAVVDTGAGGSGGGNTAYVFDPEGINTSAGGASSINFNEISVPDYNKQMGSFPITKVTSGSLRDAFESGVLNKEIIDDSSLNPSQQTFFWEKVLPEITATEYVLSGKTEIQATIGNETITLPVDPGALDDSALESISKRSTVTGITPAQAAEVTKNGTVQLKAVNGRTGEELVSGLVTDPKQIPDILGSHPDEYVAFYQVGTVKPTQKPSIFQQFFGDQMSPYQVLIALGTLYLGYKNHKISEENYELQKDMLDYNQDGKVDAQDQLYLYDYRAGRIGVDSGGGGGSTSSTPAATVKPKIV